MSSEAAHIARSAAASQQQQSWANETPQQQQTCRTANATQQQESWVNESSQRPVSICLSVTEMFVRPIKPFR